MRKQILHIDMDAFFVSVEEVLNPFLKGKPVVVGGNLNGGGVVAAASYSARKYGVHSAMPIVRAKQLCPGAIFLLANHKVYTEFSKRIFEIFHTWSPRIQPMSLDEAYIDLTGCERLHGPILSSAQRIRESVKIGTGINCSIGIASNKLLAKIASTFCKPNGMLWIAEGMEQKFLTPLPIDYIPGIGPKTSSKFQRMGVKTVGQLSALPRQLLEETYGPYGAELHNRAKGIYNSPVNPREEARSISREITFHNSSGDPRFLLSKISHLIEKAVGQLRKEGLYARGVTLKLRYSDFKTTTKSRALAKVSREDHIFYKVTSELFRETFNYNNRLRMVGVRLTSLTKNPAIQAELFANNQPEQWDKLYQGIDRIRKKYGFESILHGSSMVKE